MSFSTKKPMGDGLPHATDTMLSGRGSMAAPAFRPQAMRSVRMHPMLAGGVAALVFVLLVGYGLKIPSQYAATSVVIEDPAPAKVLSDGSVAPFDSAKYDAFLAEQTQMAQRIDVVKAAVAALPASTWQSFGATERVAAGNIQGSLKVARVPSSYQVAISLMGTDPAKTADVVNAVTSAYLDAVRKASSEASDQRAQLLADERQRIDEELQSARAEQTALGATIGVANAGGSSGNPYDAQLSGIRSELISAQAAHDVAAAQLSSLSGLGPTQNNGLIAAADDAIANDPGLSSMKANMSARRAVLSEQMSGMTPTNPIYKQDQDQIADMDRTLTTATAELRAKAEHRLQDRVKSELERTGDLEARLNGELNQQIAKATSAAPKMQRATEVAADIQRLDVRQAAVDDALRALRLQLSGPSQVRLGDAATIPDHPEPNRKKLLLMAALPLALLLGIAAAVFARKQDKRIYAGRDIEELMGFPPLALLPARGDVSSRVFEEYVLRLAAGIESAYKSGGSRTFLLSAVSLTTDTGPVTTALARKFEELGVDVVVATTSEVLAPTGQTAEGARAAELAVGREGFVAANLARIKAEHGLVLIQAEPLLNCAQTEYVARCADVTILLIECGVTTRLELVEAASLLERLNVTGIGTVLEELQLRFAEASYRLAIEAVERRQSAPALRQETRAVEAPVRAKFEPLPQVVMEAAPTPAATVVEEPVSAVIPEAHAEAEIAQEASAPIVHEVVASGDAVEAAAEVDAAAAMEETVVEPIAETLAEPERTRIVSPVQTGATLLHAEPSMAAAMEEDFEEETVANGTTSQGTIRRGFAGAGTRRPVLVTTVIEQESQSAEKIGSTPSNQGKEPESREKIAPKLSARRPSSDGDSTMTRRNISWLDRLLGRNELLGFSIVPDRKEGDPYFDPDSGARKVAPVEGQTAEKKDELDLPLMARLDQISGSRPVAPGRNRDLTRLQIVPPEYVPVDAYGEQPHSEHVETSQPAVEYQPEFEKVAHVSPMGLVPAAEEYVAEVAAPVLAAPVAEREPWVAESAPWYAEPAPVVAAVAAPVEVAAPIVEAAPVAATAAPAVVRGPRRPLSFQQLTELNPSPVAAVEAPAEVYSAPPVAGVVAAAPVVAVPEVQVAPVRWPDLVAEPAISERLMEPALSFEETPGPAVVEELAVPKAFAEPIKPRIPAEGFSEWGEMSSVNLPAYRPGYVEPEPVPVPVAASVPVPVVEPDDIEPVYQEASRHLTTGRWDPIPPLRPSGNGWRDRPSPVPASNIGRRRDDVVAEELGSIPANHWIPERAADPVPPTESLPEPMLTRQWGLLSRFQQSRNISSGTRPAGKAEAERETAGSPGRRQD